MEEVNKKVEGTEEKPKSLIDRFWWVIPPVFITFVYWPLIYIMYGGHLSHMSFELYIHEIKYLFIGDIDVGRPIFFWSYFLFGSMAVGMLLARKQSLILRTTIPIIFAILGHFVAMFVVIYTSNFFLK